MLRDIRNYIREHRKVSLQDIAVHFGMDESALTPILDRFEADGSIKIVVEEKCAGCTMSCIYAGKAPEMIVWCN